MAGETACNCRRPRRVWKLRGDPASVHQKVTGFPPSRERQDTLNRRMPCNRLLSALAFALVSAAGHAGVPTLAECDEASDFIANAAHARDNGMQRDAFLERMQADFVTPRAFPPALRWFARDDADERF